MDGLKMTEHSGGKTEHLLVIGFAFFKGKAKVVIEQQMIASQHEKKEGKKSGIILLFGIRREQWKN
jgi:hypothetical protein